MKLFVLLSLFFLPDNGQEKLIKPFEKQNLSYQYNLNAPTQAQLQIARYHEKVTVFVALKIPATHALSEFDIKLHLLDGYQSIDALASYPLQQAEQVEPTQSVFYFKKEIPDIKNSRLLIFSATDLNTGRTSHFDIAVPEQEESDLLLFRKGKEMPVFDSFISTKDAVSIKAWYAPVRKAHMYTYYEDFEPAHTPMDMYPKHAQEPLKPHHLLLTLTPKASSFSEEALYFIQKDTTHKYGLSFVTYNQSFPKLNQIEQLIGPVIYLTSKIEYEHISNAENKKRKFDEHWIKLTAATDRARQVIRSYYQRITEANLLFTTYKEGWKTDQGMVYTLMGPPDEVYRNDEKETWIYKESKDMSEIKFTFAKINNLFTSRHYQLERSEKYAPYWHRIVDLWRKGRTI